MIFNMSTGGASTADKIKYDNTESGLQSTDVQGAVDELNSSLNDIGNYSKLFEDSGAFSQKTVSLSDNISNYKELVFYMTDGLYLVQSIILPVDLYRVQNYVELVFTIKGGAFSGQSYYAKYIDDDTVQVTGNNTDGRGIVIYGIK